MQKIPLYKIQWRAQGAKEFSDWVKHRYGPDKETANLTLRHLQAYTPGEGRVVEYEGEWPPAEKSVGHICFSTLGFEYYRCGTCIHEADFNDPIDPSTGQRPGSFYATRHGWKTHRSKGMKFLTAGAE